MGTIRAVIFDVDGTLVDSNDQHARAWVEALAEYGYKVPVEQVRPLIGMGGDKVLPILTGLSADEPKGKKIAGRRDAIFADKYLPQVRPLPGARELLQYLTRAAVPWAIATSGWRESAQPALDMLGVGPEVTIITRDLVRYAKPDPDLFVAAAEGLGVSIESSVVVGDSVWDLLAARRARALGVGLLAGGYGEDELVRAGAYRVYEDPADLLNHLDEVGVRIS